MKLSSLDKSLRVIDLLSKYPQGISLSEMSASLGYPKATIHHILRTLHLHDYISQDRDTKKYMLGYKFLEISKGILDNIDIRKIAAKHLRMLYEVSQEAVHLAVLRNGQVVYIDKSPTPPGLSLATYIGFTTDPHAAAGGKVLMSELPHREVKALYRGKPLKQYGKNTITDLDLLLEELKKVRAHGYALDDEEYYVGVRCVAAPVRAGGEIVAALSITGSIFTMTTHRIHGELTELVVKTAERISNEMRW
jgi:IclR family acetate operon transcriptional repressor